MGVAWRWLPDTVAGFLVLLLGLGEVRNLNGTAPVSLAACLVVLLTALAVGVSRAAPAVALGVVWCAGLVQLARSVPVLLVELAVAAVAFGAARWGRTATVWAAPVSIAAGSLIAGAALRAGALRIGFNPIGLAPVPTGDDWWGPASSALAANWFVTVVVVGAALLGMPWLAGLVLRISTRARDESLQAAADLVRERRERAQVEEIARMREEQSRMARDVHDVVGHSLAVILAQAQAGEYLPDDNPAALKRALATIADSARGSLRDVRQVLSDTRDQPRDLDALIEKLRVDGHPITSTEIGYGLPLPPERAVTSYRVLQEMLTNAIRHGSRGGPITIHREWGEDALMIEVRNPADQDRTADIVPGHGLYGMQQRLIAAGGALEVTREADAFRVTARIPVHA